MDAMLFESGAKVTGFEKSETSKLKLRKECMPVVSLQCNPLCLPYPILDKLAVELQMIVASALDVPENNGARLTPNDIEIRVSTPNEHSVNSQALEIMIWAHQYPERFQNIDERRDQIAKGVRRFIDDQNLILPVDGWVWLFLLPSAFGKI